MRRLGLAGATATVVLATTLNGLPADAAGTTARSLLTRLDVRAESGAASYSRQAFRYPVDTDGDSCDTRDEVLTARSAVAVRRSGRCRVTVGRWLSSYDGRTSTRASDVRVDHLVSFKEAWESGARRWSGVSRRRFANDLAFGWSLHVVSSDLKVMKGTKDPAQWMPPRGGCRYAMRWVAVKYRWRLSVDRAEKRTLRAVLTGACGRRSLRVPKRVTLTPTGTARRPDVTPPAPPDVTPPTAPSQLAANVEGQSVVLSWSGAGDDGGLAGYDVHRSRASGFVPDATTRMGTTVVPGFVDAGRPSGTAYYRIVARDVSGNATVGADQAHAAVPSPGVVTLMAAGDIACAPAVPATDRACRHGEVAQLVTAAGADWFAALGDLQYDGGTYAEYVSPRGYDSAFGPLKSRTLPVLGNHEYFDPVSRAKGYFDYFYGVGVGGGAFGARPDGYYARVLGGWQLIALNSECEPDEHNRNHRVTGGCGVRSPQYRWLESVLAADTARCTVVVFHRPRWTTGRHVPYAPIAPMWDLMVRKGVDVVVTGHNHSSEVFRRIGVSGAARVPVLDPGGIRSFVAGAGGKSLSGWSDSTSAVWSALEARDNTTFGPLRLTLGDGSFDWEFTPLPGQTFTNVGTAGAFSGSSEACH